MFRNIRETAAAKVQTNVAMKEYLILFDIFGCFLCLRSLILKPPHTEQ